MEEIKIGIDFSLISPSVCILKNNEYHFISFFNDYGKDWYKSKNKTFQYHRIIKDNDLVELIPYTRNIDDSDYRTEQISKHKDALALAQRIVSRLKEIVGDNAVKIGLEGYSFASKGQSFIDLIIYNSFLRSEIIRTFGEESLVIISPTEGKKHFSGKGNAKKEDMIGAFIDNHINDERVELTRLWQYCKNNELDYKNIKPIDDLIDSIGILSTI